MDAAFPSQPINIVFVRALQVATHIGYYAHEKGHTQPLVIDVEISVAAADFGSDDLTRTIDYDTIAEHARTLARTHVDLVETFAERLAALCLAHPLTLAVRIRIDKPQAIADAIAGVEIVRLRR